MIWLGMEWKNVSRSSLSTVTQVGVVNSTPEFTTRDVMRLRRVALVRGTIN